MTPLRSADGRLLGFGKMARDRTDAKLRESALMAQAADLREADRKRTAFLATVAHELRNPLAPLQICAHLLKVKSVDPEVRMLAERMERQVKQLGRLVEDLVDTARACRGEAMLARRIVDFRAVVALAVETAAPKCDAAGHALHVALPEAPVRIDGDPDRLGQVVVNLLNNAAKFTPVGGRIGLALEAAPGEAVLRIRDSGIGIAADRLESVFGLFSQGECDHPHARGGLGIGLALVRELVALHGGTVEARSEGENLGSEFVVRLPLARG